MGLGQKQAVAILYLISGMLGVAAVLITTSGELKAVLLLLAFFVALVLGWFVKKSFSHEKRNAELAAGTAQQAQAASSAAPEQDAASAKPTDDSEGEREHDAHH